MARTPSSSAANQLTSGLAGPIAIIKAASLMVCRDALREPTREAQAAYLDIEPRTWLRIRKKYADLLGEEKSEK